MRCFHALEGTTKIRQEEDDVAIKEPMHVAWSAISCVLMNMSLIQLVPNPFRSTCGSL
jgi:hypothetical protein